jgi:hypothetical protein
MVAGLPVHNLSRRFHGVVSTSSTAVFYVFWLENFDMRDELSGRAARAGTRAARIVRVFKALTLLQKIRRKGLKPPSVVGQLVNDGIQRKIIVIVAVMLVMSELLSMIGDEHKFKPVQTDFTHALINMQVLYTYSLN